MYIIDKKSVTLFYILRWWTVKNRFSTWQINFLIRDELIIMKNLVEVNLKDGELYPYVKKYFATQS